MLFSFRTVQRPVSGPLDRPGTVPILENVFGVAPAPEECCWWGGRGPGPGPPTNSKATPGPD